MLIEDQAWVPLFWSGCFVPYTMHNHNRIVQISERIAITWQQTYRPLARVTKG